MRALACLALLLAFLLAASGSAGPPSEQAARFSARGEHGLISARRPCAGVRSRSSERLLDFTARKSFDAKLRFVEVSRRAERLAAEERIRREGSPEDLTRYRAGVQAEDAVDALTVGRELRRLALRAGQRDVATWWRSLGPTTRRVLLRSGLELRGFEHERDRDARLRAVEHAVESRERRPDPFSLAPSTR